MTPIISVWYDDTDHDGAIIVSLDAVDLDGNCESTRTLGVYPRDERSAALTHAQVAAVQFARLADARAYDARVPLDVAVSI